MHLSFFGNALAVDFFEVVEITSKDEVPGCEVGFA
jgi:hypothetical protein